MKIAGREIGGNRPCFIVAEAGLAHGGDPKKAFELIDLAVEAGADAVKFQVYKAEDLVSRDRDVDLYNRFKSKELSYYDFKQLREYAEVRGIIWFATPHTKGALEFLESLMVPCYKVGSGERGVGLFYEILGMNKPVFISTGLRDENDILYLTDTFESKNIIFLHCVTQYPVPPKSADLLFLKKLKTPFGYSSHCVGYLDCLLAVALGAKIIEKHIKLLESTGQDCAGALFGDEFKGMVKLIRLSERMLGDGNRHYTEAERKNELWALKGSDGRRPL